MPSLLPVAPHRLGVALLCLCAWLSAGDVVWAQGNLIDPVGPSAKAAGRGGASTAVADDALSAARNPALLTEVAPGRLDFGLVMMLDRFRERSLSRNEVESRFLVWPVPSLGYTSDAFALEVEDDPSYDEVTDYRPSPGPYVALGLHQPVFGSMAPTLSVAYRLSPSLSVGASLNVLLTYLNLKGGGGGVGGGGSNSFVPRGIVRVHYQPDGTPVVPPQPFDAGTGSPVTWAEIFDLADSASGVSAQPDDENDALEFELKEVFGAGLAAALGLLWTPREDLSVGLAFRPPGILFNPRGKAEIDITRAIQELEADPNVGLLIGSVVDTYLPDQGRNGFKTEFDAETDFLQTPMLVSLGVAWWPHPRWLLSLDVRWINWSLGFDRIEMEGEDPDNADLIEVNGGTDVEYTFDLGWKDQVVVAVGTTVAVADWLLLRAGYNYGSPGQPDERTTHKPFSIQHRITFGATFRIGPADFDVAYLYGLPIQVDKRDESFKIEQHQVVFGLGYAF